MRVGRWRMCRRRSRLGIRRRSLPSSKRRLRGTTAMTVCRLGVFGIGWRGFGEFLVAGGAVIERPAVEDPESSEKQSEWQARVEELVSRLTADVPADVADRS